MNEPTEFPRATTLVPDDVPLRLKFLMLPVATPSARTEPETSFLRNVVGVSTTVRGITLPVAARSTSVACAMRVESDLARLILPERIPGRGATMPVSFTISPAKCESESIAT